MNKNNIFKKLFSVEINSQKVLFIRLFKEDLDMFLNFTTFNEVAKFIRSEARINFATSLKVVKFKNISQEKTLKIVEKIEMCLKELVIYTYKTYTLNKYYNINYINKYSYIDIYIKLPRNYDF